MDEFAVSEQLTVHVLPARHYSGRSMQRNRSLWVSFALVSPSRKLYFSGDSGFGSHFEHIGRQFGGFDLAALDSGQYDVRWPLIHMNPEQAAEAAQLLGARALLPAHVGRFAMARHTWDEPLKRLTQASTRRTFQLLTPVIGEIVDLDDGTATTEDWWAGHS